MGDSPAVFAVSVGDLPKALVGDSPAVLGDSPIVLAGVSAALSGTILAEDLAGVLVDILKDQKPFTIRRVYLVDVVLKFEGDDVKLVHTHLARAPEAYVSIHMLISSSWHLGFPFVCLLLCRSVQNCNCAFWFVFDVVFYLFLSRCTIIPEVKQSRQLELLKVIVDTCPSRGGV